MTMAERKPKRKCKGVESIPLIIKRMKEAEAKIAGATSEFEYAEKHLLNNITSEKMMEALKAKGAEPDQQENKRFPAGKRCPVALRRNVEDDRPTEVI
jgi:hypothetical protein